MLDVDLMECDLAFLLVMVGYAFRFVFHVSYSRKTVCSRSMCWEKMSTKSEGSLSNFCEFPELRRLNAGTPVRNYIRPLRLLAADQYFFLAVLLSSKSIFKSSCVYK